MKKLTAWLLAAVLSVCMGIQPVFAAVSTNAQPWAKDSVLKAYESGIAQAELLQKAISPITRGEFCRASMELYCLMTGEEIQTPEESPFTDCDDPYVLMAYDMKIISGMGDGTFRPDAPLTREQLCIILTKLLDASGVALSQSENGRSFTDISGLSQSSQAYIQKISGAGFMSGYTDGTFLPHNSLKVEEALVVLVNVLEYSQTPADKEEEQETEQTEESTEPEQAAEEDVTEDKTEAETGTQTETEAVPSGTVSFHGKTVSIGMTVSELKSQWGEPAFVDGTVYNLERYVYKDGENGCLLVTLEEDRVLSYYALAEEMTWNGKKVTALPSGIDADIRISSYSHSGIYEDEKVQVSFPMDFTGSICGVLVSDLAFAKSDRLMSGTTVSLREDIAQEVFLLINTLRSIEGEAPLTWEAGLSATALDHSTDMVKQNYFDYNSPDGTTPFARMQKKIGSFYTASEVIANVRGDVPELFTELIKNTGKYNIITDETMTHGGVGVASSTKTLYLTMDMCGFAD